jgi:hypothetical protein
MKAGQLESVAIDLVNQVAGTSRCKEVPPWLKRPGKIAGYD